ncbi:SUMF1/EgtB/PvdO family nonheme iron enzyme, partial [candidate division KSB1 bacterium]|nr:SUMF1/EgtB/PvdO family nonheme iron enzyme [candidate division KSB1 bacterium]
MKCLISIVSIMFLMSCSSDSVTNTVNLAPRLEEIESTESILITGETITLTTSAIDANNDALTFVWSSQGGQFSNQVDMNVQTSIKWTAPQEQGIYIITCIVSDGKETDIGVFIVDVVSIPSLVFVESGAFDMGDNFDEGDDDERPVHTVFLDAYSIGKYEVTNEQFAGFLNDTINDIEFGTPWYDISNVDAKIRLENGKFVPVFGFEDHPVAWVTWFGAR